MKLIACVLLIYSAATLAALGVLVSQSTRTIAGQLMTVCTYNVLGDMVETIQRLGSVCAPSINI